GDPERLRGARRLFQGALLLRLQPEQRASLTRAFEGIAYGKLNCAYNFLNQPVYLSRDYGASKPIAAVGATMAYELTQAAESLMDCIRIVSGRPQLRTIYYTNEVAMLREGLGETVAKDLIAMAQEHATAQINRFMDDNFKGNRKESLKEVFMARMLRTDYQYPDISSFDPGAVFSSVVRDEVMPRVNASILNEAAKFDRGYEETTSLYRDIGGMVISLPGQKVLPNNFMEARDLIARFALADDSVSYGSLSGERLRKANLVLGMISRGTLEALSQGIAQGMGANDEGKPFPTTELPGQLGFHNHHFALERQHGQITLRAGCASMVSEVGTQGSLSTTMECHIPEEHLDLLARQDHALTESEAGDLLDTMTTGDGLAGAKELLSRLNPDLTLPAQSSFDISGSISSAE
nr:hypothetical protein [Succinivibrionaceae bacterium]